MALGGKSLEGVEGVEVIVGTYEEFVLGYKLNFDEENERYSLQISFTNHTQSRSIRAVTTVGKFLAAGSADESINLINMDARVEHGSLQEQNGTITCLTEHDGNHLFSGCEDGTICIWRRGSWLCEKTFKNAHPGGVLGITVHPSGKLALSIGSKDKSLKTWNLVKGRLGYVTNLKAIPDAVKWSPEGIYYAVSLQNRVDVYSLENAKIKNSLGTGRKITCLAFINDAILVLAGDKDTAEVWDVEKGVKLTEWTCHKNRVKALEWQQDLKMLFTASNDGFIKIWRFKKEKFGKVPELITELDTACRITCMTIWKKEEVDDPQGEEEDDEVEEEEIVEDDEEDDDPEGEEEETSEEEEEEPVKPIIAKRRKLDKTAGAVIDKPKLSDSSDKPKISRKKKVI